MGHILPWFIEIYWKKKKRWKRPNIWQFQLIKYKGSVKYESDVENNTEGDKSGQVTTEITPIPTYCIYVYISPFFSFFRGYSTNNLPQKVQMRDSKAF